MDQPVDVFLVDGPLPMGDPREWLSESVVSSSTPPATRVMAAQQQRRFVAITPQPDAAWIAAVDDALLDDGVEWVGGIGTALLKRGGGRLLTSFARLRWPDGTVWLRLWLRLPGMPIEMADAETHEGQMASLPSDLRRLFPQPRGLGVVLHHRPWSELPWLERYGIRQPNTVESLPEGATLADFTRVAAHFLEARVVIHRQVDPVVVAWIPEGIAMWWGEGLQTARRLGQQLAHRGARAAGLFGLGQEASRTGHVLGLVVEAPGGQNLLWMRRFVMTEAGMAQWTESSGSFQQPAPPLGWFDATAVGGKP